MHDKCPVRHPDPAKLGGAICAEGIKSLNGNKTIRTELKGESFEADFEDFLRGPEWRIDSIVVELENEDHIAQISTPEAATTYFKKAAQSAKDSFIQLINKHNRHCKDGYECITVMIFQAPFYKDWPGYKSRYSPVPRFVITNIEAFSKMDESYRARILGMLEIHLEEKCNFNASEVPTFVTPRTPKPTPLEPAGGDLPSSQGPQSPRLVKGRALPSEPSETV